MERYLKEKTLIPAVEYGFTAVILKKINPKEFTRVVLNMIEKSNGLIKPRIYIANFNDEECEEIVDFIYNIYMMKKKLF